MKIILGELEQKIMDIMWCDECEYKPADIQEKLDQEYAYTTIMTVLKNLYDKKLLKRSLKGRAYYYSVKQNKDSFAKERLKQLFCDVVNSYGDLAITQFLDAIKSENKDLDKIKKFLDENK